jgi:hypothetical protein
MEHRDGQQTQELNNLKVARATFASRLDAFEARMKNRLIETSAEPPKLVSRDIGFAKQVVGAMMSP